jgi:hypothetical protein
VKYYKNIHCTQIYAHKTLKKHDYCNSLSTAMKLNIQMYIHVLHVKMFYD